MPDIELVKIKKNGNKLEYKCHISEKIKQYFTGKSFELEYPDIIESVPNAVLVIPFMCCVLPIVWLTDCELFIPEIDRDFYESIPRFKQGFINMYPEGCFCGKLTVGTVIDCHKQGIEEKSAVFFSGGLDSTHTLLKHIDEKPDLIALWGSDVRYDNYDGWARVSEYLRTTAKQYNLFLAEIRTAFRCYVDSAALNTRFKDILQTNWWYGIQHGIGIISHAAPYVWLHNIKKVYIASSNCLEDGKVRCASDPTIDNNVAFCGCSVYHDSYEYNRQDKIFEIVKYRNVTGVPVHLHVCWKSDTGDNCSECEKCYRTMIGLWIAGDDPKNYGYSYDKHIFSRIYNLIALRSNDIPRLTWNYMKRALKENWDQLEKKTYRKKIAWMLEFDFLDLKNNKCRQRYKDTWKIKRKIINVAPRLYNFYIKLRGYKYE